MPCIAKTEKEEAKEKGEKRAKKCTLCKCQFAFLSYSKIKHRSSVAAQCAHMIIGLVNFPTSKSFVCLGSSLRKLRKQNKPNSVL